MPLTSSSITGIDSNKQGRGVTHELAEEIFKADPIHHHPLLDLPS